MKTILEREMMSLQKEREELSHEVEGGREERENLRRELLATRAELSRADNEVEKYVFTLFDRNVCYRHSGFPHSWYIERSSRLQSVVL